EPSGIAARSLAECLGLQLKEKGRLSTAMQMMLDNLPLLARYEYRQLAQICGVSESDIAPMAEEIKGLKPRPGRQFEFEPVLPALPDVIVRVREDGTFVTELNT